MKMKSKLPFSITSIAMHYLMINIILFTAGTAAASEGKASRKLAGWNTAGGSLKLRVIHVYSDSSPYKPPNRTWESLRRQTFNAHITSNVPVASGIPTIKQNDYITKIDFGTPGKSFYAFIDTGSDITWIPCTPCPNCDLKNNAPFDPSTSSSYRSFSCDSAECKQLNPNSDPSLCRNKNRNSNISCAFKQWYGDSSGFEANLSADTLSVGWDSIPDFVFGCAHKEMKKSIVGPGLIGLGRGNLSLVSQTGDLYDKTFSYCLPSLLSSQFSGSLTLGKAALSVSASLSFTPLLPNPWSPSWYYVGLKGISVGGELLCNIPPGIFEINPSDGRGGTIIDSGAPVTNLAMPAYNALRDGFRMKLSNLTPKSYSYFDTCYDISSGSSTINVPPITLHFEGGLDLALTEEKILIPVEDSVVCLAFAPLPPPPANFPSIIGNYQQHNTRLVFDIPNSRVGFAPENCSA